MPMNREVIININQHPGFIEYPRVSNGDKTMTTQHLFLVGIV